MMTSVHEPLPSDATRNLFIASFPKALRDPGLRALFEPFGAIESAKVMLDIHSGSPRGFAFVLFATVEAAVAAKRWLDGQPAALVPEPDAARPAPGMPEFDPAAPRPLQCAAGGPWFSLWRPGMDVVTSAASSLTGSPLGSPATAALDAPAPGLPAGVQRLVVNFAKHDAFNVVTASTKVYCRNIPTATSEADLRAFFAGLGLEPTTLSILPDSERAPPKYAKDGHAPPPPSFVAFVEFGAVESARRAVDETYQVRLPGALGPLLTKMAETASVRVERRKRQTHRSPRNGAGHSAGSGMGSGLPSPLVGQPMPGSPAVSLSAVPLVQPLTPATSPNPTAQHALLGGAPPAGSGVQTVSMASLLQSLPSPTSSASMGGSMSASLPGPPQPGPDGLMYVMMQPGGSPPRQQGSPQHISHVQTVQQGMQQGMQQQLPQGMSQQMPPQGMLQQPQLQQQFQPQGYQQVRVSPVAPMQPLMAPQPQVQPIPMSLPGSQQPVMLQAPAGGTLPLQQGLMSPGTVPLVFQQRAQ